MKKYLRLLSMLLTLSICAGTFFACDKKDDAPAETPPATTLTITSDFVITQPLRATDSEIKAVSSIFSACRAAGVDVKAVEDNYASEADIPKNEILVGNTTRSQSQEVLANLNNGDFTVKVMGDAENGYKIVIGATSESGMDSAAEYFVSTYLSGENFGQIPVDLLYSYTCTDIKVAGRPISEYTIVYAQESATVADKQIQAAKYADTVVEFVDLIEKATGKRPTAVDDKTRLPAGTPSIFFGKTSSTDDDYAYANGFESAGAYSAKILENGNVVLAGNNACAVLAAGEAFTQKLREAQTDLTSLDITGEKNLITVACIGDSITYGTNSSDTSLYNYPVYLQRMLGYDYYVEKYGAPSHSLIETDTQSFLKHNYFNQSVATAPDVVLVMLGTNDCRTQKWEDSAYKDWTNPQRTANFLAAGEKLIAAYREANPDVQIILTTPPTVPQDAWLGSDWTTRIQRYGTPLLIQLATEQNCSIIDVFTYTKDHPEIFHCSNDIPQAERGDGLHPQNETYGILAQGIYDMIKDFIKKP